MGCKRYFCLSWLLAVLLGLFFSQAIYGMKYDYVDDNTDNEELECQNGGVVKLVDGKRICSCFDQYFSGPFCEAPRGYCLSGLCLNGGTCNDYPGGYICSCSHGFYGKRCTHRSKNAPSASNPRLLIPILEVTSNVTPMFLVMDQLPKNETMFIDLNIGDNYKIEYVLPRDNDKFTKYGKDTEDGSRKRSKRGDLKGVSSDSYVASVQVGTPREGRNTVGLTARLANQRDHFAHAYSYYRRTVAQYMKYEYYGCSPNKTSPYAVFTGFGTTMSFSVSIDIAPRYKIFPKVRFAWSLLKVFGCQQQTAQTRTCYANPKYARGEYNFANFKGKRRERDFDRRQNFVVLKPFDEYMQYEVSDHVTVAAFGVRAYDAAGKEYSAYHNLLCWVEFDDEFYVPWPPYASAHASNRSGMTYFSTRNVIHPYLPLYRQPRAVSDVAANQDMGSKFTAQRGALMRCGGNVVLANAPFVRGPARAYDCPPSDLSKCFCRMLISRDILWNQTEYYYTSYYFLPGVLTSGHYVYMTYFPNFRIPAMELRMKNNYHRFANPHLPIDVEVACVLSEMNEDYEKCNRYRRRVWWQISPPLPISTDRMDVIVSSYRGKAVVGETYNFRSRARWSTEEMYDLSMRVTIEPNIYDYPTCVLAVLEISYWEWKEMLIKFKTPLYFRLNCAPLPQKYAVVPYMEEDNQFQFGPPHLYKIYGGEPELHGMVLLRYYRSYYKVGQRSRTLRDGLMFNNFFHRRDGKVPLLFVVQGIYGTYTRKRYVFPEPQRRTQNFTIEELHERIEFYLSIYSPTAVSAIACLAYQINLIGGYDSTKENQIIKYIDYVNALPMPDGTGTEQIHSLLSLMRHYIVRSNMGNYTYNLELAYLSAYERIAGQLRNMTVRKEGLNYEHIGNIAMVAFENIQEILFRNCKEHFCESNKVVVGGKSASAGVQNYPDLKAETLDQDQHLALSNTWLKTIEGLFQSMASNINAGQQPFMFVDNRKLLIASFQNLSPMTRNAYIRDIYFYARGFSARVAIANYTLNVVTGMVVMHYNFHFEVDPQVIDTPVVLLRFYNEPSDNALRNFENVSARYRPYPPGSAMMIASLTVNSPYDTTAWVGSTTDPDGLIFYLITVESGVDMQIVFHPTKAHESFEIAMSQLKHPSHDDDRMTIDNKGLRFILPHVPQSGPFLNILITSEKEKVPFNFSVYSMECFHWDLEKEAWDHVCEAMEDTWRKETWAPKVISCKCSRLNLELAAQIYTPTIRREFSFKPVQLGAILFNNTMAVTYDDWYPVIYIVGILILAFFLLNLILICWCPPKMLLRKNLEAAPERVGDFMKAIYFQDNCASWTYTYLVGVETDWRYRAGTTSNICLQVFGKDGKSMAHLLRDGYKRVIFPGTCTYFLMKTEKSLGQLLYVKLWSDMSGEFAAWFCARVHICEILMNNIWIFNVNRWFKLGHGNNCFGKIVSQPRYVQPQPAYVIVANFHRCVQRDHPLACLFITQPRSTFTLSQRVMVMIATMSVQAVACAAFVGVPSPSPMALTRESNVNLADKLAIIAIMVSFLATAANYVMSYFFRNVVRKKKEAEDWDQEIIECGMPFSNQYFKLGGSAAGYNYLPRAGGLVACIGWELCPSPRGVGAKHLDCAGNEPPPPAKLLQLYTTIGTFLTLTLMVGGWLGTLWLGMHFNEDRAWEFTCCFVGSIFLHVACMEPLKALMIAAVAGFKMEDSPRDMGNLDTIVLSDIYKAAHIDINEGMNISKNIRRLDPVYRVMTTKQEELRAVSERNVGSASGASVWYIVWSIMVLGTMLAITANIRLNESYYSWKATVDLFYTAKWGGFPATKIDTFEDMYDFFNSTLLESLHPLPEPNETMPWMVDATHKMIGVGRLRQAYADDVQCREKQQSALDTFNRTCGLMSEPDKPSRRFALAYLDLSLVSIARAPFVLQSSEQTESFGYKGLQRHFEGNGMIAILGRNRHNTIVLLNYLKDTSWLNNRTAVVFFEITIYSNDASTFSYAMVSFERSQVGYYLVTHKIWAARLFPATPEESRKTAILFAAAIIMLFLSTCYLIAVDAQQTFEELSSDKWHFVDISAVVLAMIVAVMLVLRSVFCDVLKEDLDRYTSRRFVSTHGAMIMDEWAGVFLGCVVFCCIIRLCKHFLFHDSFRVMGRAVIHATGDVVSYAIGLFFCSLAVATSFHLLLWRHFTEYSTLKHSIMTTLTPRNNRIDNSLPFINGGALTIVLGIASIILIVCYLGSGLAIFMVLSFARIQRRPTGMVERTQRRHKVLYWAEKIKPKKPQAEGQPA